MKSQYVKLLLIALGIVVVIFGVLFAIPSVRKSLFSKPEPTELKEGEEALDKGIVPDVGKDGLVSQDKMITARQVFELNEKLRKREELVFKQEKWIERKMQAYEKEKKELEVLRKNIERMYEDISQFIPLITEGEKKNLKKLSKMFATLNSTNANPIMERMPDQTLVIVLSYMKPRASAKLLGGYAARDANSAKRTAKLTEMMKHLVVK